eukprot:9945977-Alexandrium_andersonii.AAC.1
MGASGLRPTCGRARLRQLPSTSLPCPACSQPTGCRRWHQHALLRHRTVASCLLFRGALSVGNSVGAGQVETNCSNQQR